MNIKAISMNAVGATQFFLKKNGPALLTGAGVAGFVTTNFLVGKAVLKSREKASNLLEDAQEIATRQITDKYSKAERVQDMGRLWQTEVPKILKDFAPAIATGAVSIFCLVASQRMMHQRQIALMAAYTAVESSFRAYRKRVEEEIGEQRELELYRGVRVVAQDSEEFDPELPCVIDGSYIQPSPYAKIFDPTNPNWEKNSDYNRFFLQSQQNYFNNRLQSYGFVFLNEVYEGLGFERTQAGQVVGWKRDSKNGDGVIDFGLFDLADETGRAFVNGLETCVLLDFNVDGPISISS